MVFLDVEKYGACQIQSEKALARSARGPRSHEKLDELSQPLAAWAAADWCPYRIPFIEHDDNKSMSVDTEGAQPKSPTSTSKVQQLLAGPKLAAPAPRSHEDSAFMNPDMVRFFEYESSAAKMKKPRSSVATTKKACTQQRCYMTWTQTKKVTCGKISKVYEEARRRSCVEQLRLGAPMYVVACH